MGFPHVLLMTGLVGLKYMYVRNQKTTQETAATPVAPPAAPAATPAATPAAPAAPAANSDGAVVLGVAGSEEHKDEYQDEEEEEEFLEQFTPQTPKATVSEKPWMRTSFDQAPPKTEKLRAFPKREDRDDMFNLSMSSALRDYNTMSTTDTLLPISSMKQYETPIEPEMTEGGHTGGLRGATPQKRYHKFVFNQKPSLDISSYASRGNFAGPKRALERESSHIDLSRSAQVSNVESFETSHTKTRVFNTQAPSISFHLDSSQRVVPTSSSAQSAKGAKGTVSKKISEHVNAEVRPSSEKTRDVCDVYDKMSVAGKNAATTMTKGKIPSALHPKSEGVDVLPPAANRCRNNQNNNRHSSNTTPEVSHKPEHLIESPFHAAKQSRSSTQPNKPSLMQPTAFKGADPKLAEEETRVTNIKEVDARKKQRYRGDDNDSSTTYDRGNIKDGINACELTTQPRSAPQNTSLSKHLRTRPTASVTACHHDIVLKNEPLFPLSTTATTLPNPYCTL